MSKIQWTDETWNPIVGCSRISEGCKNCYAAETAKSARLQQFSQYKSVSKWDGKVEFLESQLIKPLSWKKPKKIFICSMSDLFHENIPDAWIDKIFAVMVLCPQHTFQILTKRPTRMLKYFSGEERLLDINFEISNILGEDFTEAESKLLKLPLPNAWIGVTVENQKAADERIPLLMEIPAVVRFLSCEPLLESLDLSRFLPIEWSETAEDWIQSWLGTESYSTNDYPNWIIVGLESGSNARRCDLQAVHTIINQCQTAKVKVFCKQLGTVWAKESGTYKQDRKGGSPELWDKSFNVQEFPNC